MRRIGHAPATWMRSAGPPRYADCIDSDYDVGKCEDRCRDKDFKNNNNVVDKCENCLDDKSCTGSVFACGAECASIVP